MTSPTESGRTSPGALHGLPMDRIVIVQAEAPRSVREHIGAGQPPLSVGTTKILSSGRPVIGVLARLTLSTIDASGRPLQIAAPLAPTLLEVDRPSRFGHAVGLVDYPSDFVPRKAGADVLLVGHARSPEPTLDINGHIAIEDTVWQFSARAGAPASQIPLAAPYLSFMLPGEGSFDRCAPVSPPRPRAADAYDDDFDFGVFNVAPAQLVRDGVPPDALIRTKGLLGTGEPRSIRLPGLVPVITFDAATAADEPLEVRLETLWLDVDSERLVLVWRAEIRGLDEGDLDRVVVSLEEVAGSRSPEDRQADLQRGVIHFALTEEDVMSRALPPDDDVRLEAARYATWGAVAPEPRLDLDQYARISAELAEYPDQRRETLRRHELDESRFLIEERAWLERFASEALEGAPVMSVLFGELFVKAQDSLATPEEAQLSLQDYASLKVRIQRSPDLMAVLDEIPLRMSQWMRLDRRWLTLADTEPQVREDLDQATRRAEAELPEPADPDEG